MAVTEGEYASIRSMVQSMLGKKGEYFTLGKVIKRDASKRLIWLKEFGDQPIPIVAFKQKIRYFDQQANGSLQAKEAIAEIVVPAIGEIVLVARELGTRRLPRCLGVIQSVDYVTSGT